MFFLPASPEKGKLALNAGHLALLVIAADDGVMPQTVEHLEILNLLKVPSGLVAVSKIDLVEKDWLDLVIDEIKKLVRGTVLDGKPILPVSPVTGQGMDALKDEIFRVARDVQKRRDKGVFRLPIDRVFTIKGFGTVVAGTVLSGRVAQDDTVELLPHKLSLRVRGIQVHDRPVTESGVGFRTAINLMGIEKETLTRGDVLAEPGFYRPSSMIDAQFALLKTWSKNLRNRARVRIHIGTSEMIARIILLDKETYSPGDEGFIQLHFEKPVVADIGDRYVVRSYSPLRTLGGGIILETHPPKHKRFQKDIIEKLERLSRGDPTQLVLEHLEKSWFAPLDTEELARSSGMMKEEVAQRLVTLEDDGKAIRVGKKRFMSRKNRDMLKRQIVDILEMFHHENPLRIHMSGAELLSRIRRPVDRSLFDELIQTLKEEGIMSVHGNRIQRKGHTARLTPALQALKERIEKKLLEDPFNPPSEKLLIQEMGDEAKHILTFMTESGDLVRLEGGIFLHKKAMDQAEQKIRDYLKAKGQATVSDLKQHLGTTRKYAVPLLFYLDNIGLTERDGDFRKLNE
ncbi:MAG: SelB C-terminal domain-containing protein [bacterium]